MTQILAASSFERDRKGLPDQVKKAVDKAIDSMVRSGLGDLDVKVLKNCGQRLFRVRINDYRIILQKQMNGSFVLLNVAHRKDVYRTL